MARYSLISLALISAFFTALAAPAQAQPSSAQPEATTPAVNPMFTELDRINSDSALIKAKLDNARLRKELADLEAGRSPAQNSAPTPFAPGPTGVMQSPSQFSGVSPSSAVVLLVTSSPRVNKGLPTALIRLPNGSNVSGTAGTKIPGVGTLRDVSVSQVTAQDGKSVLVIPFDSGQGGR